MIHPLRIVFNILGRNGSRQTDCHQCQSIARFVGQGPHELAQHFVIRQPLRLLDHPFERLMEQIRTDATEGSGLPEKEALHVVDNPIPGVVADQFGEHGKQANRQYDRVEVLLLRIGGSNAVPDIPDLAGQPLRIEIGHSLHGSVKLGIVGCSRRFEAETMAVHYPVLLVGAERFQCLRQETPGTSKSVTFGLGGDKEHPLWPISWLHIWWGR